MAEPDEGARVYGDEEIGRILKRATELQRAEPAAAPTGGVTLAELEEIGAEAGIDARYLRRAAMELETHTLEPSLWARVVGDHLVLVQEIRVPGELPDSGFERVAAVIQAGHRAHGQIGLLGRTLTWRAEDSSKTRTTQVTVSVRAGETRIHVEERLHQLASGLFGGTVTGIGVGVGVGVGVPIGLNVLGSVLFAAAAPVGLVGLTYFGCRAIYRAVVRRRSRALADLLDRAAEEIRTCIAEVAKEGVGDGAAVGRRGGADGGGPPGPPASLPPVTPP